MAKVPAGGYKGVTSPTAPGGITTDFDTTFGTLITQLEQAWTTGGSQGQSLLGNAVGTMFGLKDPAVTLMQTEIPGGGGSTYGPDFIPVFTP